MSFLYSLIFASLFVGYYVLGCLFEDFHIALFKYHFTFLFSNTSYCLTESFESIVSILNNVGDFYILLSKAFKVGKCIDQKICNTLVACQYFTLIFLSLVLIYQQPSAKY